MDGFPYFILMDKTKIQSNDQMDNIKQWYCPGVNEKTNEK